MGERTHTVKITTRRTVKEHYKARSSGRVEKEKQEISEEDEEVLNLICTCGKSFDSEAEAITHLSGSWR